MKGLSCLKHMTELILTGNQITKIKGLKGLGALEVLWVDKNKLPFGENYIYHEKGLCKYIYK